MADALAHPAQYCTAVPSLLLTRPEAWQALPTAIRTQYCAQHPSIRQGGEPCHRCPLLDRLTPKVKAFVFTLARVAPMVSEFDTIVDWLMWI